MRPFFVPGRPISSNHIWARSKTGSLYLTRAARTWRDAVYYATLAAKEYDAVFVYPKISYRFTGCKADADNLIKCTQDGLKMALGRDDQHFSIGSATVTRTGAPGVWITIEEGFSDEQSNETAKSRDDAAAAADGLAARSGAARTALVSTGV